MSADRWAELERLIENALLWGAGEDWFDRKQIQTALGCDSDDAAFIAAASPATVLELIAAARQQSPEKEPGT